MFEIPNAKRVRRQDLYSESVSPTPSTPDEDLNAKLRQQYEALYPPIQEGEIALAVDRREPDHVKDVDELPASEEEAFEFRLFSKPGAKPSNGHGESLRILIRSPSPVMGEPGFTQPRRPDSCYFIRPTEEQKAHYEVAAISAEAIEAERARKWPGCALPWRVTTLRISGHRKSSGLGSAANGSPTGKVRAGKKRRIIIRKKLALLKAKEAAASMSITEKEAAEREKRTRKNREKKVKKKAKEKLKKNSEVRETVCA